MQMLITFMAVVAGLIFSIAVALLAEELIFGQIFKLFFVCNSMQGSIHPLVPQAVPLKSGEKR